MATKNPDSIFVNIDGESYELLGADLESYLLQNNLDKEEAAKFKSDELAKQTAQDLLKAKLLALGLTSDDVKLLGF
jgi:hypothetical protein